MKTMCSELKTAIYLTHLYSLTGIGVSYGNVIQLLKIVLPKSINRYAETYYMPAPISAGSM